MMALSHKYILKFLGTAMSSVTGTVSIITEMCEGDLKGLLLSKMGKMVEQDISTMVEQIVNATDYMHRQEMMHRDLKPANILFNCQEKAPSWEDIDLSKITLKVADFALARQCPANEDMTLSENVGTPAYWAPEISHGHYNAKVDIYSIGVITFELFMKGIKGKRITREDHRDGNWARLQNLPHQLRRFLEVTLVENPRERSTAATLLIHPFLIKSFPLEKYTQGEELLKGVLEVTCLFQAESSDKLDMAIDQVAVTK